mmetsp:Transcript_26402/g.26652  ORF Transcript_26402/g.26652 Transcript_26402/m.26652 type:complete len:236 (+) Transcript_26402:96-803(+)|eukprot:CAMPEP_0182428902 /NCGR_PEP_ID=MMETSP1167-20130531/24464_1 /TAXON_ID=2988 /ORGANISM="Mallomonas Sp, Strain CCMP3275" /LENGTH=235 /DNA_ID=CAMNT_0024612107 /DNA_START=88 /DNA_END=795 /DNA_ORIENTATION=+
MEGGLKCWRNQTIINNSPSLESYSKPLPPPPDGFFWEKLADGNWQLFKHASEAQDIQSHISSSSAFVEHVILPGDTLMGICLRYGASVLNIRRVNNFSGNAFRSKKVLRIPIQPGIAIQPQEETPEVILQIFKNETNESDKEARYYLEEHEWDLPSALESWKRDDLWATEGNGHTKNKFSKQVTILTLVTPNLIVSSRDHDMSVVVIPDRIVTIENLDNNDPTVPLLGSRSPSVL